MFTVKSQWLLLLAILATAFADSENPLDALKNGFVINKPSPISESDYDKPFTLECQVPEGKTVDACQYFGPNDQFLTVEGENVFEGNDTSGDPLEGVTGITGNPRSCGLQYDKLTEDHLGEWNCYMDSTVQDDMFRMGTFQLLTVEQGWAHDIRLPRHLEVSTKKYQGFYI